VAAAAASIPAPRAAARTAPAGALSISKPASMLIGASTRGLMVRQRSPARCHPQLRMMKPNATLTVPRRRAARPDGYNRHTKNSLRKSVWGPSPGSPGSPEPYKGTHPDLECVAPINPVSRR
jgi:hypothetical protein